MTGKEREILTRFYLDEQTRQQICIEMNISDADFRISKWRAKGRLVEFCRRSGREWKGLRQ